MAKFKLWLTCIAKIRKKLIFTYSDNGNEISGKIAGNSLKILKKFEKQCKIIIVTRAITKELIYFSIFKNILSM